MDKQNIFILAFLVFMTFIMVFITRPYYIQEFNKAQKAKEMQQDFIKINKNTEYLPVCYVFSDHQLEHGIGIFEPEDKVSSNLRLRDEAGKYINLNIETDCDTSEVSKDFVIQQRIFNLNKGM